MTMSQKLWIPLLITVLCVIGAFVIVATAPSVEYKEPARAIPTVRTISAQTETHRHRVRTQGTVAPRSEADLVPEISGRVVWISSSLAPGGFFERDEPLLRLERRDFELAVKRQRAAVQRAASELEFAASETAVCVVEEFCDRSDQRCRSNKQERGRDGWGHRGGRARDQCGQGQRTGLQSQPE